MYTKKYVSIYANLLLPDVQVSHFAVKRECEYCE